MRPLALLFMLAAVLRAEAVIAIQPFGVFDKERLEIVRKGLKEAFGLDAEVLAARPHPKDAWYAPRGRWRAERLLDFLGKHRAAKHRIVIGLTASDISTTKEEHEDWGIFGLGELGGRTCVVSTFRLGARGADETKLRDRLRKVAIHEAGHVMGLEHCPGQRCVMRDAESSIATVDGETGAFCESCLKTVAEWKTTPP